MSVARFAQRTNKSRTNPPSFSVKIQMGQVPAILNLAVLSNATIARLERATEILGSSIFSNVPFEKMLRIASRENQTHVIAELAAESHISFDTTERWLEVLRESRLVEFGSLKYVGFRLVSLTGCGADRLTEVLNDSHFAGNSRIWAREYFAGKASTGPSN
jgi:hypothetical protein